MNTHIFLFSYLGIAARLFIRRRHLRFQYSRKARIHQLEQDNASLQQQQKQLQKRNQSLKGEQKNVRSQY